MSWVEIQDRVAVRIVGGVYLLSGICGLVALVLLVGRILFGPLVPFRPAFLITPTIVMLSAKVILAHIFRWSRR